VASNPNYYHAYVLAGDMAAKKNDKEAAIRYYEQALTKEIATLGEKKSIGEKIRKLKK
jgi:isopenicillin-N N-acyltransferase-like protein